MKICRLSLLVLAVTFHFTGQSQGQPNAVNPPWKLSPLLEKIELKGPFSSLLKKKRQNPQDRTQMIGFLSYVDGASLKKIKTIRVGLKLRGHSAWREGECDFPKLTVNFLSEAKDTPFAGLKKIKVGTHCGTGIQTLALTEKGRLKNPVALVREVAIYNLQKTFGLSTLETRLVQARYIDSSQNTKTPLSSTQVAFFLDDEKEYGRRNGFLYQKYGEVTMEDPRPLNAPFSDVVSEKISPLEAVRVKFFEIAVGNNDVLLKMGPDDDSTDGASGLYNIEAYLNPKTGNKFLVPYDYDLAGTVTGRTALETWGQRGPGLSWIESEIKSRLVDLKAQVAQADYESVRNDLFKKKTALLAQIERSNLDGEGKALFLKYLNAFYKQLGSDES